MGGPLGEWVNDLAKGFNDSQKDYKVVPTFKGTYDESLPAAIAAYRAGNAPNILQVYEVGTATMMASKGAIVPVWKIMKDAGQPFDTASYVPAVAGYYTAPNGQMLSLPFNSSTTVFFYNKDAFKAAGLDPNKPPSPGPKVTLAAAKLKASGSTCPLTTSWQGWTQLESFSAWHNVEFATKNNGFGGTDARLVFNGPLQVRHIENLANMAKQGLFVYKGRGNVPDAAFISGECAMSMGSSSTYGQLNKVAKFAFGFSTLPYYPDVPGAPQNTIIGGASLWAMSGKPAAENKGVAAFFDYLSNPDGAGRQPPAHRLPADHQGRLRADGEVGLLPEEPGHRRRRQPDDQEDDRQVARRAPRQLRADPRHRGRRARAGLGRQEDGQGRARRSRQARQRAAGQVPGCEQALTG